MSKVLELKTSREVQEQRFDSHFTSPDVSLDKLVIGPEISHMNLPGGIYISGGSRIREVEVLPETFLRSLMIYGDVGNILINNATLGSLYLSKSLDRLSVLDSFVGELYLSRRGGKSKGYNAIIVDNSVIMKLILNNVKINKLNIDNFPNGYIDEISINGSYIDDLLFRRNSSMYFVVNSSIINRARFDDVIIGDYKLQNNSRIGNFSVRNSHIELHF